MKNYRSRNTGSSKIYSLILLSTLCGVAGAQVTMTEDAFIQSPAMQDDDRFGHRIAVNDEYLVIAAEQEDPNGASDGVVRIYNSETGELLHTLFNPSTAPFARFGESVAISDDNMVVVRFKTNEYPSGLRERVRMYDASTGVFVRDFVKPEPLFNDRFADTLAVSEKYLVVGNPHMDIPLFNSGEVDVYDRDTGMLLHRLTVPVTRSGEDFGTAIAIEGTTIYVWAGQAIEYEPGMTTGSVIWIFDAVSGSPIDYLYASDFASNGVPQYYPALDIDDGVIAVGSFMDNGTDPYAGAVYLYDAQSLEEIRKIIPPGTGNEWISFGKSVALDEGIVVAGATRISEPIYRSGGLFAFEVQSGVPIARMLASEASLPSNYQPLNGLGLGRKVAINRGRVWSATANWQVRPDSMYDNGNGPNPVYAFTLPNCLADITGDGTLDFFDIAAFLTAFTNQDPIADFTADGFFDFFDIAAFLTLFSAGCP